MLWIEIEEAAMEKTKIRRSLSARGSRLARSVKEAGGARWSGGGLWWLLGGKVEVLTFFNFFVLWDLRGLECGW